MGAPALRIPISADVTQFQQDMNKTSAIIGTATRAIAGQVIKMNAGFLATQGVVGGATLAFGSMLPVIGQVILAYKAVTGVIDLMGYATNLAKARIEEFNGVAEHANKSGFSTDFFQRITKGGATAAVTVGDLTEALKKFNDVSTPKLGGSDLQKRIDELSQAGNLQGNTGVRQVAQSSNGEQRLRGTVDLIDQAMQKGERLAAIDLAGTAFGPAVATALRADSGYLDGMLQRADAMSKAKIISEEDVGRAVELKERMDAAQRVLSDKWKPVQDDLAKLGMNYHESWVSINEDLAAAVGYATDLYVALKQVPDWFANRIGNASIWKSLTDATGSMGLNSDPAALGITTDPAQIRLLQSQQLLNSRLQNHANVTRSMTETSDVVSAVRGDTSKAIHKDDNGVTANQFDRASDSIEKHTARLEADTQAVGLGAAAQEQFRAQAQLLTAAQQAGIPVTQKVQDQITSLAQGAGAAAEKLENARLASTISFGKQTSLLDPQDVAIAQQLRGKFGDDVPAALASSEAAALRFNQALSGVSSQLSGDLTSGLTDIVSGTKSAKDGFSDMAASIMKDIEQMIIKLYVVGPLMRGLQGFLGGVGPTNVFGAAGGLAVPTFAATGGYISGPGSSRSDSIPARLSNGEFVVNAGATAQHRGLLEAINGRGFASGGYVSPSTPAIAPSRGGGGNIQIINQTSQPATATTQRAPNGDIQIIMRDMVRGVLADDASKGGPISKLMRSNVTGFKGS